jgi:hypothetical protein
MIKKRKPKRSLSGGQTSKKLTKEETTKPRDEEQPSTYGGLPNRNLKKNLGCG